MSYCIGQLGWGSGAWARPPQLNWSHVLQSLELLLSLHWPLWCWACGWSRKGRARVPGMQGGDLFTPFSPSGSPPTVTHGTLVTRSLHCCGTTGGACLIIRREDVLKKNLEENLISNHTYSRKTRFFYIQEGSSSFSRVEIDLKWVGRCHILHLDEKYSNWYIS